MYLLVLIVGIVLTAVILFGWEESPYYLGLNRKGYREKEFLLSETELTLFDVLKKVVSKNETVFAKVRQADIIETGYAKNLSQRHVDFVLCDLKTSRILTVIELNDISRQRPDSIKSDQELHQLLSESSVRLVEIPAKPSYDDEEVRKMIYGSEPVVGPNAEGSDPQVKTPAKLLSERARSQSNGKHITVETGKEQRPTQQTGMVAPDLKRSFPSPQVVVPDGARYIPNQPLSLKGKWF